MVPKTPTSSRIQQRIYIRDRLKLGESPQMIFSEIQLLYGECFFDTISAKMEKII